MSAPVPTVGGSSNVEERSAVATSLRNPTPEISTTVSYQPPPGPPANSASHGQHVQPPAITQPGTPGVGTPTAAARMPLYPAGTRLQYLTATPLYSLNKGPSPVDCPVCLKREMTVVKRSSGNTTHLWAAGICFCFCLGCIPYFISDLKDVEHRCGSCGVHLAIWHRSGSIDVLVQPVQVMVAPVAYPQMVYPRTGGPPIGQPLASPYPGQQSPQMTRQTGHPIMGQPVGQPMMGQPMMGQTMIQQMGQPVTGQSMGQPMGQPQPMGQQPGPPISQPTGQTMDHHTYTSRTPPVDPSTVASTSRGGPRR